MAQFIIPNWHPLLVHFTVALITISAVFFLLSLFFPNKRASFIEGAKLNLWAGAILTILTILAGFAAFNAVAHDDVAHEVMKTHRFWALVTGLAIFLGALWVFFAKNVSTLIIAMSVLLTGLVGITAYFGAELVYRHGLGVMRLPDTTEEGHSHKSGDDHSHNAPRQGEQKSHDHDQTTKHEHSYANAAPLQNPADVAAAFSAALKNGDANLVDQLLADDVLILEGGHAQTSKADYMAGHMKSDMAFLPHIDIEILSQDIGQAEGIAWVTTHSKMVGTYNGKAIDLNSRGFLLLKHNGTDWKISLVEWAAK